jgi:hypothetical protein
MKRIAVYRPLILLRRMQKRARTIRGAIVLASFERRHSKAVLTAIQTYMPQRKELHR